MGTFALWKVVCIELNSPSEMNECSIEDKMALVANLDMSVCQRRRRTEEGNSGPKIGVGHGNCDTTYAKLGHF